MPLVEEAVVKDNNNTHDWMINGDVKRRRLDLYHTSYGTKLFAEDGALVEETLPISRPYHKLNEVPAWTPPLVNPYLRETSTAEPTPDHSQTIRTGKAALEYYNKKHGTNYELVEPMNSNAFLRSGIWFHTTFKAAERLSSPESCIVEHGLHEDSSSKGEHEDSSSKGENVDSSSKGEHEDSSSKGKHRDSSSAEPFFAEIMIIKDKYPKPKYLVTACRSLDGIKTTNRCEICGEGILHPTSGFRHGLYPYKPRTTRRMKLN